MTIREQIGAMETEIEKAVGRAISAAEKETLIAKLEALLIDSPTIPDVIRALGLG